MVAAPSASLSTSASGPSAASSTTAVGTLQQSQPATSSSSSSQQQPGPAAGGKALVQVDAATVAAARNSQQQRNSSYITPHTLHSYQAATAAAAGPTSVGGSEPMDAPAGVATVQPSVMVACRESCRRWVAVPSNVEMNF